MRLSPRAVGDILIPPLPALSASPTQASTIVFGANAETPEGFWLELNDPANEGTFAVSRVGRSPVETWRPP
jgi:hypothetical protein